MMLRPEQQRAVDYARRRGTEAPLAEIQARVGGTYALFEELVGALEPALGRRRAEPATWSVHEVVCHLVLSDGPAVLQLADLIAGRSVDDPIPAHLQAEDPLAIPWPDLLNRFRSIHREIERTLAGAADDLPTVATAPVEMVVKCANPDGTLEVAQWIERFDWKAFAILLHAHNREHIAQAQRVLAATAGAGGG